MAGRLRHKLRGWLPRVGRPGVHGPPFIVCIDVEPDLRQVDRANPVAWHGFERFVEELPALRSRLRSVAGGDPRFTWCLRMDPQIADTWGSATWVTEKYGDQLTGLLADGDELGLHTHAWRWSEEEGSWVADRKDREWVAHCTEMALDGFEACFGRSCRVSRSGDRHLTPEMLCLLSARGLEVDLTIEPGKGPEGGLDVGERATGDTPDFRNAPVAPYHYRSADDYLTPHPAAAGPLMIPLFSTRTSHDPRSPLYLWTEPGEFARRLDEELRSRDPGALAFGVRTDLPLIPEWEYFVANLEYLAGHARVRGRRFITASAAAAELNA